VTDNNLSPAVIPASQIERQILLLRGQRVILATDLARMYGVPAKQLNQAVRRNADRFPEDFVFQLSKSEADALSRSRFLTLNNPEILKSQIVTSRWGGARRALPYAFTEHGVIMAANLLRSPRAVKVSVYVVRVFVQLREMLSAHKELAVKLNEVERKLQKHDGQITALIDAIRQLMATPEAATKSPIGYHTEAKRGKK
jgi:hypothetical protein